MGGTEIYKNTVLHDRTWAIKKLDAQTASYYAQECLDKILPSALREGLSFIKNDSASKSFTKQEFMEMQRDFLSVCFENLPAGYAPVVDNQGKYGVKDLEFNAPLLQLLLIHSMSHTLKGFFEESHYRALGQAMMDLFPQNAQTSENGSGLQSEQVSGNNTNSGMEHTV